MSCGKLPKIATQSISYVTGKLTKVVRTEGCTWALWNHYHTPSYLYWAGGFFYIITPKKGEKPLKPIPNSRPDSKFQSLPRHHNMEIVSTAPCYIFYIALVWPGLAWPTNWV